MSKSELRPGAEAVLEKFGGDSVPETRRNAQAYVAAIPELLR